MKKLTEEPFPFLPQGGLGSEGAPLFATVEDYARELVSHQTGLAAISEAEHSAQSALTENLAERVQDTSGVDIDEELSRLLVLQSAYAANARVVTVVQEMLQLLVRI